MERFDNWNKRNIKLDALLKQYDDAIKSELPEGLPPKRADDS